MVGQECKSPSDQEATGLLSLILAKNAEWRQDACNEAIASRVESGCGEQNVARDLAFRFGDDRQVGHRGFVAKERTDEFNDLGSFYRTERIQMYSGDRREIAVD